MIYRRALSLEDFKAIEPQLTLDYTESSAGYMTDLLNACRLTPERVCVFQAWEGDELRGFIVAQVDSSPVAWVSQGWSHPANPWEVADTLFSRVLVWAVALGRSCVRAQTRRSSRAMFERFGFQEIARVVEVKISADYVERTFNVMRGSNG
jgi:hypothetical protein